ncbi:MAG TPA: glycosyltransferase [Thermoanaerobaculia bacterium]|nr:glycosyltransferase [Thermoanaerobaculia bacterium]
MTPRRVSVVMGVYNAEATVRRSVDSVLAQKDIDLELVVVDDGSTDATSRILDECAAADSRVRIIRQPNRGLTRALIAGCDAATGEFIARQDAGDESLPGRFSAQAEALAANSSLVFVSCWSEYRGPGGEYLYTLTGPPEQDQPSVILRDEIPRGVAGGPTHHASVMFRADAYRGAGGYRSEFYFAQDWDLWFRLAALGSFRILLHVYYLVAMEAHGISGLNRSRQMRLFDLARQSSRLRRAGEGDAPILAQASQIRPISGQRASRYVEAASFYFIGECLRRNRDRRCRKYLRQAIGRFPLHVKAWIRLLQAAVLR